MTREKTQRKHFFIIFLIAFLFSNLQFSQAFAEDMSEKNECVAIGTGTIVKGNLVQGKKGAIRMALLKGVENYLVRLLGNQAVATHFEILANEIIPNIDQEIENFHILAEQQVGNRYSVFVKMKINENSMAEKLREAGVFQTVNFPPIFCRKMQYNGEGSFQQMWWFTARA